MKEGRSREPVLQENHACSTPTTPLISIHLQSRETDFFQESKPVCKHAKRNEKPLDGLATRVSL
eukprot:1927157-Amphidinium_carterae.1